jgi:hypothetical protein
MIVLFSKVEEEECLRIIAIGYLICPRIAKEFFYKDNMMAALDFLWIGLVINTPFSYKVEQYSFVTKWVSLGSADGQFDSTFRVAVDYRVNGVYLSNSFYHRMQIFLQRYLVHYNTNLY